MPILEPDIGQGVFTDCEIMRVVGPSNAAPTTLHLLCTTTCQMNCPGCFYKRPGTYGVWNIESARKLVSEAQVMGVKWIALGGGEPLLWTSMSLFEKACHEAGIKLAVTTNGMALAPGIIADAVHISHDRMHTAGYRSLVERIGHVEGAIEFYRKEGVKTIGLNTNMNDAHILDEMLLDMVDNVTLLMPKPFKPASKYWRDHLEEQMRRIQKHSQVCYDSCLSVLMGNGECLQGRASIAYDQWGQVSACSNISYKAKAGSLAEAWDLIRCRSNDRPSGCILDSMKENTK